MNAILTLAAKDLKLLLRDKGGLFFTFVFPMIYAVFFGSIFNRSAGDLTSRAVPVFVVDEDQTPRSAALVKLMSDSGELDVAMTSRSEGVDLVRQGRRSVCVIVPKGYGEARSKMFGGRPITLQIAADPARAAETGMVSGLLNKYLFLGMKDAFTDPHELQDQIKQARRVLDKDTDIEPAYASALNVLFNGLEVFARTLPAPASQSTTAPAGGRFAWEPVRLEKIDLSVQREGPRNFYAVSFPQGIIWGILGCTASFGVGLVMERTRGTLRRIHTTPVAPASVLAARSLACLATVVAVCTLLLIFARLFFHVVPSSIGLLAIAVICVGFAFVGLMMLLANFGKNENSASGLCWGILTLLAMIGGGMVPMYVMPPWMQQIGSVSPVKWAIMAVEGGLWREFTAAEMIRPCGYLIAFGVGTFLAGSFLAARRSRS
jgi:ABC-2 type transport system permease protein